MEFGRKREKIRKSTAANNTRSGVYHARINHEVPLTGFYLSLTRRWSFWLPLTLPLAREEGTAAQPLRPPPSPHPHPLADAGTLGCKLAKASLPGEGWGEAGSRAACTGASLVALYGNCIVRLVGARHAAGGIAHFLGLVAASLCRRRPMAAKRAALVIGNSAYTNAPALTNPGHVALQKIGKKPSGGKNNSCRPVAFLSKQPAGFGISVLLS